MLSVRQGTSVYPKPLEDSNKDEENHLFEKLWASSKNFDKDHGVAAFGLKENELPQSIEAAGFTNISVNFISSVWYCPDSASFSKESALLQIEMNRVFALDSIKKALAIDPSALTVPEQERLASLINKRYDKRADDYLAGIKHLDMG